MTKIFQLFFENLAKFSEEVKIFLQNIPSLFLFFAFGEKFALRNFKKNHQIWSFSYNYFKPKKLFLSCLRIFELHHLNHFKALLFQPTNTFCKLSQTLYSFACCDVLWNFCSIINVFTYLFTCWIIPKLEICMLSQNMCNGITLLWLFDSNFTNKVSSKCSNAPLLLPREIINSYRANAVTCTQMTIVGSAACVMK